MDMLGVRLTLLIGPKVPVPAPLSLAEALESADVRHGDEGRSGFQLRFRIDRAGPLALLDYPLLREPSLRPFNRVVLMVTFNAVPHVLIDGLITQHQVQAGTSGKGTLTVTGEDVTFAMDRVERSAAHPGLNDSTMVTKILASYWQYGLLPNVTPTMAAPPNPLDTLPGQHATDLAHVRALAERNGFVFFVEPTDVVGVNRAYWGPPPTAAGLPQRALSLGVGSAANVDSLDFTYDGLAPTLYEGWVQDPRTSQRWPVRTTASTRPPMSTEPALVAHMPMIGRRLVTESGKGPDAVQAGAQARTDASTDSVLVATGQLDASRYGDVLWPRRTVGVRGAGYGFDGLYYVRTVSHTIRRGSYRQSFTLAREGLGTTVPVVRV